jgi:hypothetical protein
MQCPEFESRLDWILDERRDPATDSALAAHAADCQPCSDLLAGQLAVLHAVLRLRHAHLVLEKPKRPISRIVRPALAVAAAMLLALGAVWQLRERSTRLGDVASDGSALQLANGAGTLAIVARGRPAAQPALLNSGDWLLEAPRLPQHLRAYRGMLGQLAVSLPTALSRLDQVDQYAPGFNNLRASFDMIWHTLVPQLSAPGKENSDGFDPHPTTRTTGSTSRLVQSILFSASPRHRVSA